MMINPNIQKEHKYHNGIYHKIQNKQKDKKGVINKAYKIQYKIIVLEARILQLRLVTPNLQINR